MLQNPLKVCIFDRKTNHAMKKRVLTAFFIVIAVTAFAASRVLTAVSVPDIDMSHGAVNVLFSRISGDGIRSLRITAHGDSLSVESDGRRRQWFAWRSDTAYYAGEESMYAIEGPRVPVAGFGFPLASGDSRSNSFRIYGTEDKVRHYVRDAVYSSETGGRGSLVLPEGDTLKGVVTVREVLATVTDSFELEYDANGNVVFDGSVPCAYEYNRFNKPVSVETEAGRIRLEYDGAGILLSRSVEIGGVTTKTEYFGPYEVVDGVLKAVYFDGGYFDAEGKVHYYVPDYQGNIIADVTARGKVEQTASYYPYGEPWVEPEGGNRRLYGGKERLNVGALRPSDFGARYLDTRSGRWNSHDPCSEDFYPLSPYSVCGGDPVNYVDPDGRRFTAASMPAVGRLLSESLIGILSSKAQAVDYARAFGEIMIMHASDQLFHVSAISPLGNTGATIYDSDIDAVTFMIPGGAFGPLGLIAHEFKHGYQFLTGEIELAVKGQTSKVPLFFYDLFDEIEAYERGSLFGADYFSVDEIQQMYPYLKYKKKNYLDIPGFDNGFSSIKKEEYLKKVALKTKRAFRINNQTFTP